ncbi:MAG: hypothetical protein H0U92_01970 [Actinobacteria bacterium]|nr:hypothetical protein [Actinomycetota bacterium]
MTELDRRVLSAVDHVQKAALELIAAMRNVLDVAEDVVADPAALHTLVQGAVIAAKTATETVAGAATVATAAAADRVERIRVD